MSHKAKLILISVADIDCTTDTRWKPTMCARKATKQAKLKANRAKKAARQAQRKANRELYEAMQKEKNQLIQNIKDELAG